MYLQAAYLAELEIVAIFDMKRIIDLQQSKGTCG
jgi:hypothetical protein